MAQKKFPVELTEQEREEILFYLEERFGFPRSLFDSYTFLKGTINFWMLTKTEHLYKLKNLTPEVVGLLFLRRVSQYLKPTSAFLQRFGKYATKNVVPLNKEQLLALRENLKIAINLPLSPGYVVLRDEDWILGCGFYTSGKLFAYFEEKLIKTLNS